MGRLVENSGANNDCVKAKLLPHDIRDKLFGYSSAVPVFLIPLFRLFLPLPTLFRRLFFFYILLLLIFRLFFRPQVFSLHSPLGPLLLCFSALPMTWKGIFHCSPTLFHFRETA